MIKEKAKEFATSAHYGQVRKGDLQIPMITHPISVAHILEEYGYDDCIVAAGYLHDVVEDTEYTLNDIEKMFGSEIADLVCSATEPDKTKSWEERKQHTINIVKEIKLRNKLVICADKIHNVEDLTSVLRRQGLSIFKQFKRGPKHYLWYQKGVYQSLIDSEDKDLPIFKRLKTAIEMLEQEIREQANGEFDESNN